MKPTFFVVAGLLVACGLLVGADEKKAQEIDGTWVVESSDRLGGPPDGFAKKGAKLTIGDGKWAVEGGRISWWCRIDAAKKPAQIDLAPLAEGKPVKEFTFRGIYKLEKNLLTICLGVAEVVGGKPVESKRPAEFKAGLTDELIVLKLNK